MEKEILLTAAVTYASLEFFVRAYASDYQFRDFAHRVRLYAAGSDDDEGVVFQNSLTKVADSIDSVIHPWKPVYRTFKNIFSTSRT